MQTGDTSRIPERKEIPDEHKWNLSKLSSSDDQWEKDLEDLEKRIDGFEKYPGTLGDSAAQLKECLDFLREVEMLDERLGYYAHLRTTEDVGSSLHQGRFSRYMRVSTQLSAAASFINPELQAIPEKRMEEFLASPELNEYVIMLKKIMRFKPHVLSPAEEKLLALQSESRQTPHKAFSALTDVDFDFGSIDTPEGALPLS